MKKVRKSEQGQVLILLTAGIITLLAFTGLSIDMGRLYAEKRAVQGTSDTTSMTGALYIGQYTGVITEDVKTDAINAAIQRAVGNGYPAGDVSVTITQVGMYYDVTTIIQSEIPPTISRIVYDGPLRVRAKTVARVYKVSDFSLGSALYAMSPTQKNALEFTGNGTINIIGAGMYSNSTHADQSITFGGSSVSVLTDGVVSAGTIKLDADVENPDGTAFTNFTENSSQLGKISFPTPSCAGLSAGTRTESGGEVYFTPGVYPKIKETSDKTYHFADGFYCINGEFSTDKGEFLGDNVTFYVTKENVTLKGNIVFRAPTNGSAIDGAGQSWNGMLFYVATGKLTINANAESDYEGTIYVPTPGGPSCKVNGTSDTMGFNIQLICDSININGDGDFTIEYDGSNSYIPPVKIDLYE